MQEREFVMIKPDSVIRRLIGRIVTRYEEKGLQILAMKLMKVRREQAETLYREHVGKDFYSSLMDFIVNQPVVVMVIKGKQAVKVTRTMIGPTRGHEAPPGTIRGDFTLSSSFNVIHASDSTAAAEREIKIFFSEDEILSYNDPNECFRI
jgi:nucleoside-diphosphate kinase